MNTSKCSESNLKKWNKNSQTSQIFRKLWRPSKNTRKKLILCRRQIKKCVKIMIETKLKPEKHLRWPLNKSKLFLKNLMAMNPVSRLSKRSWKSLKRGLLRWCLRALTIAYSAWRQTSRALSLSWQPSRSATTSRTTAWPTTSSELKNLKNKSPTLWSESWPWSKPSRTSILS